MDGCFLVTASPFTLHSPFPQNILNPNGASFYPTSTSCESDTYPSQTSASEQADDQTFGTFANGWSVGSHQDYLVGSLTSLSTEASFGKYDYNPFEDRGLTCASPQSQNFQRRTTAMTYRYVRITTGPPLTSIPSPTPPVPWAKTIPSSEAWWPSKFRQRPPPPLVIVSNFLPLRLRNQVLTNREQSRSTTGAKVRGDHPSARFTR